MAPGTAVTPGPRFRCAGCAQVILIVYSTAADAVERGYEEWLKAVDNPFFNALPGVSHYSNWCVDELLVGPPPPFTHFDLQGVSPGADLRAVWFDPKLDAFRRDWIRLWGYGRVDPLPVHLHAYLLRMVKRATGPLGPDVIAQAGSGTWPTDADAVWQVDRVIRKHFAVASSSSPWIWPAGQGNPLGHDWFALSASGAAAPVRQGRAGGAPAMSFRARLIAAPG